MESHDIRQQLRFLQENAWIYDFQITKFFVEQVWKKIPPEWEIPLLSTTLSQLNNLPYGHVEDWWPDSLKDFIRNCSLYSLPRQCIHDISPVDIDQAIRRGMSAKKEHEVSRMAAVIHQVASRSECDVILDIGSGLGYLGQVLSKNYNVIGFESQHSHTVGADRRSDQHTAENKSIRNVTFQLDDNPESVKKFEELLLHTRHSASTIQDHVLHTGHSDSTVQDHVLHTNEQTAQNSDSTIQDHVLHTGHSASTIQDHVLHTGHSASTIQDHVLHTGHSDSTVQDHVLHTNEQTAQNSDSTIQDHVLHTGHSASTIQDHVLHTGHSASTIQDHVLHTGHSDSTVQDHVLHTNEQTAQNSDSTIQDHEQSTTREFSHCSHHKSHLRKGSCIFQSNTGHSLQDPDSVQTTESLHQSKNESFKRIIGLQSLSHELDYSNTNSESESFYTADHLHSLRDESTDTGRDLLRECSNAINVQNFQKEDNFSQDDVSNSLKTKVKSLPEFGSDSINEDFQCLIPGPSSCIPQKSEVKQSSCIDSAFYNEKSSNCDQSCDDEHHHGDGDTQTPRAVMVGLHCCGDLTPTMLSYYRQVDCVRALCCVSCCYHRMKFDDSLKAFGNFPMSSQVSRIYKEVIQDSMDTSWRLNTFSMRLAAQETRARWRSQTEEEHEFHMRTVAYRGILELYLHQRDATYSKLFRKIARKRDFESFTTYLDAAYRRLDCDIDSSEMKEEVIQLYEDNKDRLQYIEPLTALQVMLQPVLESLIYKDRQLCLLEHGLKCDIVPIFDESLSPRNLALISEKRAFDRS